jgi:hypothetical protein
MPFHGAVLKIEIDVIGMEETCLRAYLFLFSAV